MKSSLRTTLFCTSLAILPLAGCDQTTFLNEAGAEVDEGCFGRPTMLNGMAMMNEGGATIALAHRFEGEVQTTVTFAFNRSDLSSEAVSVLKRQADWIRQFPEVRFRVYGYTDLVGTNAYNYALGLRRANAVVAYLSSQGISTTRLEALVSYGETRPVIHTTAPEQRNRRSVTEVSGFAKGYAGLLNGKYAAVIFREYVDSATRPHPSNTVVSTQVSPNGGTGG